mmetsp:Transcript_31028/g.88678  ORF Transcript_31028/g.88678 Transcript_31028/m.88678 type:complete len:201 (-) Transcript_31028:325-927(-)
MFAVGSSAWQASLNSAQEIALESSLSSVQRHACSGWWYSETMSSRSRCQASGSGSARSHGRGSHWSSHSRSERSTTPQLYRSRAARSDAREPEDVSRKVGQPSERRASAKVLRSIFLSELQQPLPRQPSRASTTRWWCHTAAHEPKWPHAQRWNLRRTAATSGHRSSSPTAPSESRSSDFHNAATSNRTPALEQYRRKAP